LLVGFSFSFEAEEFLNIYIWFGVGGRVGPFFKFSLKKRGEGGVSILLFSGFRWGWVGLFDKETSIVKNN